MPSRSIGILIASLLLPAAGCRSSFVTEGDALRERIMELEESLLDAERRAAELEASLAEAHADRVDVDPEIEAATPRVTGLQLGRLSHLSDADADGVPDGAVVYLSPADGRGRFLQLTGHLTVHAVVIPPDRPSISLLIVRLSPAELRDAYRSSLTGTHYTIEAPFDWPADIASRTATVRVEFTDGATGRVHSAERELSL
jgi:hypothetical protein